METALLVIRLVLAAVFLVAGFAKLADLAGSRQALRDFGVPAFLASPFGVLLPLAELAMAVALLPSTSAWWGAVGALVLLLLFVAGISYNLARGRTPDCHCFGQLHSAPAGPSTLIRNLGLAALAGLVIGFGRSSAGLDLASWLGTLALTQRIELIGGLVVLAVLVGILWLLWQVLHQQGRLLLRLEAVEARLAEAGLAAQAGSVASAGLESGRPAPPFRLASVPGESNDKAPTMQGQPAARKHGDAVSELNPLDDADLRIIPSGVLMDKFEMARDPYEQGTMVSVRTPLGIMPFILGENRTIQPHTSYLICSTPRSGSYLLCEALQQTGLAGQPTEYFLQRMMLSLSRQWGISSYSGYLNKVIEVGTTPNGVFGMKAHMDQFRPLLSTLQQIPGYRGLAAPQMLSTVFPNLSYIWITRRDKAQQAVSYLKAVQTNIWWLTDRPPVPAGEPTKNTPSFDFEAIDRLVRGIEEEERAWQDYFSTHTIKPMVVIYEELVHTYDATACQVLEYLNIPKPANLVLAEPRLKRQADRISEEWVERYHRLKRTQQIPAESHRA